MFRLPFGAYDAVRNSISEQAAEIARLRAELDAVTAERDAALERLKAMETALSTLEVLPSIAATKEPRE